MKSIEEIKNIIAHATGADNYHKVSPKPSAPIITSGVFALAEAAECSWLIDAIISYHGDERLDPNFQAWKLTVADENGVLEALDDDKNVVISQEIEYTDFPLDEINFWVVKGEGHNVMMLPSEY